MIEQKEKRKYARLNAYHLVKYRLLSSQQAEKVLASLKDISGGGISLLLSEDLPLSSVMQVYIQFPGVREPILCLAKIAWKKYLKRLKRHKVGAQFMEIDEVLRKEIIKRVENVNKITSQEGKNKKR